MTGTRDWDAGTYDRVSGPQVEWAAGVIERLGLGGEEVVLDAGCGSGRVTELFLAELPRGSVIAVDGSAAMIEQAAKRLDPGRSTLIHSDLLELDLEGAADVVFSNAVFHWIHDHGRLFAILFRALRGGGRMEAQCGGEGNVAGFYEVIDELAASEPYRPHLEGFRPNHFAAPGPTRTLLEATGFESVRCWLQDWPARPREPREFVRTVCLVAHSERLPEDLRPGFLDAALDGLGPEPELGYVRLNIAARKP